MREVQWPAWLVLVVALGALACTRGALGDEPVRAQFPPESESVVQAAREDLQSRIGVPVGVIEVLSVESVTWPDAGLGCPDPDRLYAQVLTSGYRIVLTVDGHEYVYHSSRSQVVACSSDREKPALPNVISDLPTGW